MKILIIDMCPEKNSLWQNEFVRPIRDILEKNNFEFETIHYLDLTSNTYKNYNKIIISGTPLNDFKFEKYLNKFEWIKYSKLPILGICAGFQIISLIYGEKLISCQEIGLNKIKTIKTNSLFNKEFEVYELHNKSISKQQETFEVLANSKNCIQVIKKDQIYATLFHPEVRNKQIITNFLFLS